MSDDAFVAYLSMPISEFEALHDTIRKLRETLIEIEAGSREGMDMAHAAFLARRALAIKKAGAY